MMKKKILSITTLAIFLIAGYIYLNKLFASQNIFVNVYEDYVALTKKTNVDILFYGSSHVYTAYNPLIIDEKCKTISYNLGSAALNISLSDMVLKETLQYTTPKLVVLEIFSGSVMPVTSDENKGFQLRALDIVPNYNLNKIRSVKEIYSKDEILGALFPLIRNHDKWGDPEFINNSKRQTLNKSTLFFHSGYRGHFKKLKWSERILYDDLERTVRSSEKEKNYINDKAKKDIKNFINTAKRKGIQVLIITSPDLKGIVEDKPFFRELNELCSSLKTPFLNLNEYYEEIGLTLDDFMDPEHLNIYGGTKTSQFLSNYLNDNYHFIDRSNEDIYKKNMETLDNSTDLFVRSVANFSVLLNKNLIVGLKIQDINIERNNRDYAVTLNFENDKNLMENFKKYSLSFKMFPFDEKNLSERSISKGENFDKIDISLNEQSNQVILHINSKIKRLKRLEFFIYNTEKYSGVIGDKIIIEDRSLN